MTPRSLTAAGAALLALLAGPALAQTAPGAAPAPSAPPGQGVAPTQVQNPQAASPSAPLDCQRLPGNCQQPVSPGEAASAGMPAQSR